MNQDSPIPSWATYFLFYGKADDQENAPFWGGEGQGVHI